MIIEIRRATPEDVDWLIPQLRRFSSFFGSKKPLFGDEEYARAGLLTLIEQHLFLLAEREDVGRMGFIAGYVLPHMFNPQIRLLAEAFWWVDEQYRGSRAGAQLLKAFMEWGEANVDWIQFSLEESSPVKEDAFLKRGFVLKERSFLKEVS